jgi:hypothetical protein
MPPVTVDQLQRAVAAVVDTRRAVEAKERALVASLEKALRRLGYAVVPVPPPSTRARRAPRRRGRR